MRLKNRNNWFSEHKETIEIIYIISAIFTILSLSYTIIHDCQQESEFKKALKNSLITEIDYNLDFIKSLQKDKETFYTSFEVPSDRFSTFVLEETIRYGKIGDENTIKLMFCVTRKMLSLNRIIKMNL